MSTEHLLSCAKLVLQFAHVPSNSKWSPSFGQREWLGASHAEDIPFVFGNPFQKVNQQGLTYNNDEKILSLEIMRYWTEFAKNG